jgi:hypothetical protein
VFTRLFSHALSGKVCVHVDGWCQSWNVLRENSSYNVISYVRTSNSYSGPVNIRTLLDYARVTRGWIGNGTIGGFGFGFECFGTGGASKTYYMNSCSIGS